MSGGEGRRWCVVSASESDVKGALSDGTVGIGNGVVNGDGFSVISREGLIGGVGWIEGPCACGGIDGQAIDGLSKELIGEGFIGISVSCSELT